MRTVVFSEMGIEFKDGREVRMILPWDHPAVGEVMCLVRDWIFNGILPDAL